MDVQEITPHFPTVAADWAAEGRFLFSFKYLSNWILACGTLLTFLLYTLEYPRDIVSYVMNLLKSLNMLHSNT